MKTTKLTDKQLQAIDLITQGKNDSETAAEIGVTRETVNTWKNKDCDFIAELNKVRNSISSAILEHRQAAITKAFKLLDRKLDIELEKEDPDHRVAIDILKSIQGNYEIKPETSQLVEINQKLDAQRLLKELNERKYFNEMLNIEPNEPITYDFNII